MTEKLNSSKFSKELLNSHEVSVKEAIIELLLALEGVWFIEPEKVKNILSQPNVLVDANIFVNDRIIKEFPVAGKVYSEKNKVVFCVLNDEVTEFTLEFLKSVIRFDTPSNVKLSLKKNKNGKYQIELNVLAGVEYDEMVSIIEDVLYKINMSVSNGVEFIVKRNSDLVEAILSSETFIESYVASSAMMKKTISH